MKNTKTVLKVFLIIVMVLLIATIGTTTHMYLYQEQKVNELLRATAQNVSESFSIFMDHSADVLIVQEMTDIFQAASTFEIKLTNLEVRNHKNLPDEWEQKHLKLLYENPSTPNYSETIVTKNKKVNRLISPLYINEACLKCHGQPKGQIDERGYPKEGLKLGDMAGAISIAIPVEYANPFFEYHNLVLWVVVVLTLFLVVTAVFLLWMFRSI